MTETNNKRSIILNGRLVSQAEIARMLVEAPDELEQVYADMFQLIISSIPFVMRPLVEGELAALMKEVDKRDNIIDKALELNRILITITMSTARARISLGLAPTPALAAASAPPFPKKTGG